MTHPLSIAQLSNQALLDETQRFAAHARAATVDLVAAISEVDTRRLYLGEGCSSMFVYCTRVLHLSEHAAYGRIEAGRLIRRFPSILERLADGSLTLTNCALLGPHLTAANYQELLDAARHKSKREVEHLVAALSPRSAVPATIRKLPESKPQEATPVLLVATAAHLESIPMPVAPVVPPVRPAIIQPLAPELYKVQFTLSRDVHDKLRRAQALLRHTIPTGDVAKIFERALTLLLADIDRKRLAAVDHPRAGRRKRPESRHIPASIKREVWKRDEGRCAFLGAQGRCDERAFLEFHHVEPYAAGGPTATANLELRCRAHNAYEAELFFGRRSPSVKEARATWAVETRSGPS